MTAPSSRLPKFKFPATSITEIEQVSHVPAGKIGLSLSQSLTKVMARIVPPVYSVMLPNSDCTWETV